MKLVADLILSGVLLTAALFLLAKYPHIVWAGFSTLMVLRLVGCYVKLVETNRQSRRAA